MAFFGAIKKYFESDDVVNTDYYLKMINALDGSPYYRMETKSRQLINGILDEVRRIGNGKDCKKNQEICVALLKLLNEFYCGNDCYARLRYLCLNEDKIGDRNKQPALYKALNKGIFTARALKNIRALIDKLDKEPTTKQENTEAKRPEPGNVTVGANELKLDPGLSPLSVAIDSNEDKENEIVSTPVTSSASASYQKIKVIVPADLKHAPASSLTVLVLPEGDSNSGYYYGPLVRPYEEGKHWDGGPDDHEEEKSSMPARICHFRAVQL